MMEPGEVGGGMKVEGGGGGGGRGGCGGGGGSELVGFVRMPSNEQLGNWNVSVMMRGGGGGGGDGGGVVKKVKREGGGGGVGWGSTAKERISKMPPSTAGKRSSIYRGVTRHRWTGRYEAHLWDKTTWNQNQNKKGKQVYLGAYDEEEAAARAYDLAALKYWGPGTLINFPVNDYMRDIEEMKNVSREDYLALLRRKSSGFSRGLHKYRGLCGRLVPSLGRTAGDEYLLQYGMGDDAAAESGYVGGFCMERKIDLASYIKWWGGHHDSDSKSYTKQGSSSSTEDIAIELKLLERSVMNTEPYQMPRFGVSHGGKKAKRGSSSSISALNILSKSTAYMNLQDKSSRRRNETVVENDKSDDNKSNINKVVVQCGAGTVEKLMGEEEVSIGRLGVATAFGLGGSGFHKTGFPLSPLLSAPLLTNYNAAIDHLADPIIWSSSLAPALPSGASQAPQLTETETSSTYTIFGNEET